MPKGTPETVMHLFLLDNLIPPQTPGTALYAKYGPQQKSGLKNQFLLPSPFTSCNNFKTTYLFCYIPWRPKKGLPFCQKNTAGDIALQAGNKKTMCLNMDRTFK